MPDYLGYSYTQRGGDEQFQKRFQQLEKMQDLAIRTGEVDEGFGVPEGLKSAFFRMADVISRPNYAIAGFFDTLAGTGQKGEYAIERSFRELFSGVAGLEGDKEFFGDVLEQAGVGEGGSLSDLVGENGVTRRWDPTLRGAVGLALDIFTDPLTWISAPAKNAAVVMGRGGRIRYLTREGMEQLTSRYEAKIASMRKSFGLADDVGDDVVLRRASQTKEFEREYGDLAKAISESDAMAEVQVAGAIRKQLGRDLLEETGGKSSELFLEEGLRFRIPGAVDVGLKADRAFVDATRAVGGLLRSGMERTDIGRFLVKEGDQAMAHLAEVFTRHPLLAHKNKAYIAMEEERFALHNGAEHMARLESQELLAGVPLKVRDDEEFVTALARTIENFGNPEVRAEFMQVAQKKGVEDAQRFLQRWQNRMLAIGRVEVKNGLLQEEMFKGFANKYFPRDMSKVRRAALDESPVFKKGDNLNISLGSYAEPRHHDSWDEFVQGMRDAGHGDEINFNLNEVLQNRLRSHYQAMVDLQFVEEVNRMFGISNQAEINAINKALAAVAEGGEPLSKGEQKQMMQFLRRSSTYNGHDAARQAKQMELVRIQRDAPETQAIERLTQIVDKATEGLSEAQRTAKRARAIKVYKQQRIALRRAEVFDLMTTRHEMLGEMDWYRRERKIFRGRLTQTRKSMRSIRSGMKKTVRERVKTKRARAVEGIREARRKGDDVITGDPEIAGLLGGTGWLEVKSELRRQIKDLDNLDEAYRSLPTDKVRQANRELQELDDPVRALLTDQRRRVTELRGLYEEIIAKPERAIRKLIRDAEKIELSKVDQYVDDVMAPLEDSIATSMREAEEMLDLATAAKKEINGEMRDVREYVNRAVEDVDELNQELSKTRFRSELLRTKKKLARTRRRRIEKQMREALPTTERDIAARDVAALRRARPEVRAAVIGRMMSRITSVENAEAFFKKYDDVLASLDSSAIRKARAAMDEVDPTSGKMILRDDLGQPYVNHTIRIANKQVELNLPQGIVQDMQRWSGAWQENPEVTGMLRYFDFLNNTFKIGVTRYFMSFNMRNLYSNVAASFMDIGLSVLNPKTHRMALQIMRGADGTMTTHSGRSITYHQIRNEIDSLAMRNDKLKHAELGGQANKADPIEWMVQREMRRDGLRGKVAGAANKFIQAPGGIENEARIIHYMTLRMRGFAPADAARQVNKFLFDYSALSSTARNVFKRIFPFWTWTSKNIVRQAHNLIERPGRMAAQVKVLAQDRGPEGDELPEYLRGQLNVSLKDGPKGSTWITNIDLPISNVNILWAGGIGATMRDQIGMITPILKQPIEFGLGKEVFSGRPTRGINRMPGRLGAAMDRNLPGWAKDFLQLEKKGEGEDAVYTANSTKVYLVFKSLFLGRLTSEGVKMDELAQELGAGDAAKGAFLALRLMTGLQLRDMDLSEERQAMLYNRSRRLEDILVNSGRMVEFSKAYIPKEEQRDESSYQQAALVGAR